MSNSKLSLLTSGFVKNNPTFVLLLGMCPTLAVTTSLINAIGMGLSATFVLICSNLAISCKSPINFAKFIFSSFSPNKTAISPHISSTLKV